MESCLFCKIIKKEISAEIVYEDDAALGVLDIHPRAPGHTMVMPKKHMNSVLDLEVEDCAPLMLAVRNVTAMVKKAMNPDGFIIGINHGRMAGQEIDHLHIHIIPRYKGDGGHAVQGVVNNPPKESLDKIKNQISKIKATN